MLTFPKIPLFGYCVLARAQLIQIFYLKKVIYHYKKVIPSSRVDWKNKCARFYFFNLHVLSLLE